MDESITFRPAAATAPRTCRFCDKPALYVERICQNCIPMVRAVQVTAPGVLEKIIREVNLARFLANRKR